MGTRLLLRSILAAALAHGSLSPLAMGHAAGAPVLAPAPQHGAAHSRRAGWLSLFDAAVLPAAAGRGKSGARPRPYILVAGGMQNLEDYQGPEPPPVRRAGPRACVPSARLACPASSQGVILAACTPIHTHARACTLHSLYVRCNAPALAGRGRAVYRGEVCDSDFGKCVHTARPAARLAGGVRCSRQRAGRRGSNTADSRGLGQWWLVGRGGRRGGGGGVGAGPEHDDAAAQLCGSCHGQRDLICHWRS